MKSKLTKSVAVFIWKVKEAFNRLSKKERWIFYLLILFLLLALGWKIRGCYLQNTKLVPARGGVYREGVIGHPELNNPLLASNGAEKSVTSLVYQKIYSYNQKRELVPGLAEKLKSNSQKDKFTLILKENLKWSDGEDITAEDVVKTIEFVQKDGYEGPLKETWQGVGVEKAGKRKVNFKLKQSNSYFKELLVFSVMPAHVIKDIEPEKLSLHKINKEPIASGPYNIDKIIGRTDTTQVILSPNQRYNGRKPYLKKISLVCYPDYSSMLSGLKKGEVSSVSFLNIGDLKDLDYDNLKARELSLPQITGAFFNLKNKLLKSKSVREALIRSVNKEEIISHILKGHGLAIKGPGLDRDKKSSNKLKKAKKFFEKYEKKHKEDISLKILTSQNDLQKKTAHYLADQWEKAGVEVKVRTAASKDISYNIQSDKSYDVLLFGQNLGAKEDLYPYWHSSQIEEGFNLSKLKNDEIDNLLEEIRQTSRGKERKKKQKKVKKLIRDKKPALFLYTPYYLHLTPEGIKGVDEKAKGVTAEDRFFNIDSWYLNEKRVRKKEKEENKK